MCGRFNLRTTGREVGEFFHTRTFPQFDPLYNVAPTDNSLIVAAAGTLPLDADDEELDLQAKNDLAWARWGLLPVWLKDIKGWAPRMNARSETVVSNNVFRSAFKSRRCLVPVTGFYEWKEVEPRKKQPFHIQPTESPFLPLAGVWEVWRKGEREVLSCSVLTCEPNETMVGIHDRMPVILAESDWERWLDPETEGKALTELLVPCADEILKVEMIATTINNARNKSADALQPVAH